MHIRESDTSFQDFDADEQAISVADEYLSRFHKRSDLDILANNCAHHTDQGTRVYQEAAAKPY